MKKSILLGLFLAFSVFFCAFVYAADVAYILSNDRAAKSEILDVFSEFGFSVDLIEDADILDYSLSDYGLIFVDNVRLRKTKDIPIYNYPSIIMNRYYGREWGLTDNDGISQLASNRPLSVRLLSDGVVQVYTQARGNGVSLPYYYLSDENKAGNMSSVARTYMGSTSYDLGDVVSFAPAGTGLRNGIVSGGDICFYGISETEYWTDNARDLFMGCINEFIQCSNDSDCPEGIVNAFCVGNQLWHNISDGTCSYPGQLQSSCAYSQYLNETCPYECSNGNCIRCDEDLDCNDNNASSEDRCLLAGTESSRCENTKICFAYNTTGLISWWKFDESSGNIAIDSADSNNGILFNNPKRTPAGKICKALRFDRIDEYVNVSYNSNLDVTKNITMEAWIRPKSLDEGNIIINKGQVWCLMLKDGNISAHVPDVGGSAVWTISPVKADVKVWQHVAVTYDGSNVKLYKNGLLIGSNTASGDISTDNLPLMIGANSPNPFGVGKDGKPYLFNGTIDEVAIYSRALTSAEIQRDYNLASIAACCI